MLEGYVGTVSIGGRVITSLRFANDIDGLVSREEKLKALVEHIDRMAKSYGMKINADKMKVMMKGAEGRVETLRSITHV